MADITVPEVTLPITPAQISRGIDHIVEQVHPHPRQELCMRIGEMERRLASYAGDLVHAAYNDAIAPDARQRLARHLYLTSAGDDPHAVRHWDSGAAGDSIYRKYEQQAEAAIAAYEGVGEP